jgi:beta-glucosidase
MAKQILLSGFFLAVLLVGGGFTLAQNSQETVPAYKNTSLPFELRAADLVSRMTLEEKVRQMQSEAFPIPRLGIQYYNWSSECLHGIANDGGTATVFPQAIGLAATWDVNQVNKVADVISTEARAWYLRCLERGDTIGIHKGLTYWSPNINIFRDPRWGRGQETYGEDPYLTSRIGVAFVKGLQGNDPKYFKTISTPKHYAVHSGPEPLRHVFDPKTSKRDLYETYLPAFEACVKEAGAFSIMGAYSKYLGVPCCASELLLDEILRKQWGFQGYVVSDCGAIADISANHRYARDLAEASAVAVKAGCDITCGTEYTDLEAAFRKGYITEAEIDKAVQRLMLARMKLGMFDPPEMVPYAKIPSTALETPEHQQLALETARKSIVLLKNQNHILPLNKNKIKSVAVIGPYIMRDDLLYGNYNGISTRPVTFLQGIRNKLGDRVKVEFTKGLIPFDQGGALQTVPTQYVRPAAGTGHGLTGEYFDNPDLQGNPVFTRTDSGMVQYWDKNSPGKGIPADFFSVRWTGTITPPETGTFLLGIITDDRGRMYFENSLVVDNWNPCQKNVMKTFRARMEKGKEYSIRIDYADSVEYAGIRFQWKRDDADQETIVPEKMFEKAISIAKSSDVVLFYGGISANLEGEEMSVKVKGFEGGDKTSLDIPENQEKLLKALYATGKPIVLVLSSGSALSVNWEQQNIPAILHAWYPGQEGGNAVADVIFGDYNPAGRLPVTFYKSLNDIPSFVDYNMKGRTYRYFEGKPLYPFGYGLSYTSFRYSNLKPSKTILRDGDSIQVSLRVANQGKFDGDEVVQLYVKNLNSKEPQPRKSLKGFKRVHLKKGESAAVEIPLTAARLKYFSEKTNGFVLEPGKYEIQVGGSSEDVRARTTVEVKSEK